MAEPYDPDLDDRMRNMEPSLLHLLIHEINSFGRWDALRFYLEGGAERATMDQIGLAAGRDSATLLRGLGELASLGWLARRANDAGETEYILTQARDRRLLLDQLHTAMHDRAFRLQAIYHWTRGRREG